MKNDESNNLNQSDHSEHSNNEFSNSETSNNLDSGNNICFIDDEDSRLTLIDQRDKIIYLQNAEKYLDKELSATTEAIKPLFVQYIALQRHTLRRHLKVCKNMIKDLGDLVESLNEETVPSKSLIHDELQLWTQELEKTFDRILKLKAYFLEAISLAADSSDYSMIRNTPLFVMGLKNTKSILHSNFELTYKYISDVHKMQKNTTTAMEDIIKQHEMVDLLISKILDVFPIANRIDTSPNFFTVADQSTNTSNNNSLTITEENLPPQQSEDETA